MTGWEWGLTANYASDCILTTKNNGIYTEQNLSERMKSIVIESCDMTLKADMRKHDCVGKLGTVQAIRFWLY